jgi:hypothetical protein
MPVNSVYRGASYGARWIMDNEIKIPEIRWLRVSVLSHHEEATSLRTNTSANTRALR